MKTSVGMGVALLAVAPAQGAAGRASSQDSGSGNIPPAAPTVLEKVEVTARQEAFYNAIDRKVYVVGKDVVSATGSAGDLLQNVPSVQVDVEGEVSLRGDSGVTLLVNGKSSAALERDAAAALEAMPADSIERVEIITNPSAKYRPDGTAGIINLVLKRSRAETRSGTLRASVGNDERYNVSLSGTEPRGRLSLSGRVSVRQDYRPREGFEVRTYPDAGSDDREILQRTLEEGRPRSVLADAGFEFKRDADTTFGGEVGFGRRDDRRESRQFNHTAAGGTVLSDHERIRTAPEAEREWEIELRFRRAFDRDRELEIEVQHERETEREDEQFETIHRSPQRKTEFERTSGRGKQDDTELTIDYSQEFDRGARLEAGYAAEIERSDQDEVATQLDALTGAWLKDPGRSDRFRHDSAVHAVYATYGRPFGPLGVLGGLRFENARDTSERPEPATRGDSRYNRLYPSLHFTYDFGESHRLQFNYSHRVDRPSGGDLNPFVDYEDPSHLRAGNPALRPEHVHSVEAGYEFRAGETSLLASIYHRYRYDGVTDVTRLLDANTLITIPENVGTSRSSGLELGATARWRKRLALNFSANVFRHEIDARNLGFAGAREATAWEAKLNAQWNISPRWLVQVNTSYRGRRLTAQGERLPSSITNVGVRYDLKDGRTSLIATVSDLFGTSRDRTVIDTPALRSDVTRRRSSQVFYLGIVRHFGKPPKKSGDELEFDDALQ